MHAILLSTKAKLLHKKILEDHGKDEALELARLLVKEEGEIQ